ncbi:MAG TPA: tetratricopeptide repeat protein [Syntrophales bacterium]|jgi:tetratricopeptide (TPR) repeat protein|nr:tetratricopeptide repeat protein [Syntrophales bacterium]HON22868.1 tetratricopeptide repeat protein [Syntrophales bacterium]HPC32619.1 tetratricopeptide repeat protein [Syntrophales bacterium]HQG34184.1 tetratricopeptide repeat protein [Syntrophales bacterium]HQI35529.1 tetratricopeptide repeat protein [Syntrophales bacterium]
MKKEAGGEKDVPEILNATEKQRRAEEHLAAGRYAEAVVLYRELAAMHPGEDSFVLKLAWAYHDGGWVEEAVACFEDILERELQQKIFTGFAFDELVRIFKRDGRYDRLAAICERAVTAQPDDYSLLGDLGEAYLKTGATERAAGVFRRMTEMEPEDAMAFCRLGNALAAAGDCDGAEASYRRAAEIEPLSAAAYYGRLAVIYSEAGHADRAVRMAARCVQENPAEPAYHLLSGDLLIARGDLEAALAAYERAAALRPECAATYANRLGNTLAGAGRYAEAVTAFRRAAALDPQNPFYLLYLADAYRALGREDEAREVMDRLEARG